MEGGSEECQRLPNQCQRCCFFLNDFFGHMYFGCILAQVAKSDLLHPLPGGDGG